MCLAPNAIEGNLGTTAESADSTVARGNSNGTTFLSRRGWTRARRSPRAASWRVPIAPPLQGEAYRGFGHAVREVLAKEGVPGLYRGVVPALLGLVPAGASGFFTYARLKEAWQEKTGQEEVGNLPTLFFGAASGVVSTALTFPLEAARKQISITKIHSTHSTLGTARQYTNMLEALSGIVKNRGLVGLYEGLAIQCLTVVPTTALTFLVFETAKRVLVAEGEEKRDEIKA